MTGDLDWSGLSTGLISDCQGRYGAMTGRIQRLVGERAHGPALTVQVVAGENSTIHRALTQSKPGDMLVVDAGGYRDRAVWGEILARAAIERGLAGVVIDGAVRDVERLGELGLPTWARGVTPAGPHKGWAGRIQSQIACGSVSLAPGDTVVGDGDGVVVVRAKAASDVHRAAVERQAMEGEWLRRIRGGETTVTILGLDEEA